MPALVQSSGSVNAVRWRRSTDSASTNRTSATRPGSLPTSTHVRERGQHERRRARRHRERTPWAHPLDLESLSVMPRACAGRSAQVQAQVQRGDGVGERADGEVVDAGLGVGAGVLQAAGRRRTPGRWRRCPAVGRPRRCRRRVKLSSSTSSAPRASTSSSCSSVSTSTSHGRSGAWRRAAASAAPTEPAAATWLSLISTASPRPSRWLTPPPQRTAYFSSSRRPGRVLRVSRMRAPVPSTASTQARVAVATPERWQTRLSAVRSAVSRPRTGARTASATSPAASRSPSARAVEDLVAVDAEHGVEHRAGGGQPGQHARRRGR